MSKWTPRRLTIYRYLQANPGATFPAMRDGTGIPHGSLSMILNYMHTTYNEVRFEGPKGKRRYFAVPGHFVDGKEKLPRRFQVGHPGRAKTEDPDAETWGPTGQLPEGRCASVWEFAENCRRRGRRA